MARSDSKRGSAGGKKGAAPANAASSHAGDSSGTTCAIADAAAAQKAKEKEIRLECAKAFACYKKGNVRQGGKDLEKLLKAHPNHPLPHYAYVRISHKVALGTSAANRKFLEKAFKETRDRAKAALVACPDSLVIRLLFAQVVMDTPLPPTDDHVALRAAIDDAHVPTEGTAAPADFKHAKAAASFDDDHVALPLFPDLRECVDSKAYASEAADMMKATLPTICEVCREAEGLGARALMSLRANGETSSPSEESALRAQTLVESYIKMRDNRHNRDRVLRHNRAQGREQERQRKRNEEEALKRAKAREQEAAERAEERAAEAAIEAAEAAETRECHELSPSSPKCACFLDVRDAVEAPECLSCALDSAESSPTDD
mgnify:CR=1 FL=1